MVLIQLSLLETKKEIFFFQLKLILLGYEERQNDYKILRQFHRCHHTKRKLIKIHGVLAI